MTWWPSILVCSAILGRRRDELSVVKDDEMAIRRGQVSVIITPMTSEEMAERILRLVVKKKTVSFVEIVNAIGPAAKGDLRLQIYPNLVLWDGVSPALRDALASLEDKIEPILTNPAVYWFDGAGLQLPVAKHMRRAGYKTPHWAPVVFNPKPHFSQR